MKEYINSIIAFIAVLLGVFGDTWNPKQKGLKKLLFLGWLSIIIGALALAYNLYQIYEDDKETELLKMETITSLESPVSQVLTPLQNVLIYTKQKFNDKNAYFIVGDNQRDTFVMYMKSEMVKSVIDTILLKRRPFRLDSVSWLTYVQDRAAKANVEFSQILGTSDRYLDNQTKHAIRSLLNDPVFKNLQVYKLKIFDQEAVSSGLVRFSESDIADLYKIYDGDLYEAFLDKVKKLYDICNANRLNVKQSNNSQ